MLHAGGQPGTGITDPHIDTTFNLNGHYAAGQKIGIIEDNYSGLFDNHEAFSQTEVDSLTGHHVTYEQEPQDCSSEADCTAHATGDAQACINLGHTGHTTQCVSAHASQVASVASGTNGGVAYGAAKAHYYYPNGTAASGPHNGCSPSDLLNAYDWLANQGVSIVNESWGCQNGSYSNGTTLEGITQDWYARHLNMAIFKSSGDQIGSSGLWCSDRSQAACPYSLNSTCVGANAFGGGHVEPYSSYRNLNGYPDGSLTDREEPDLSMFGGALDGYEGCGGDPYGTTEVDVLDFFYGGTTDWARNDGTSFAAPAAASMAALCQEMMSPLGFSSPQRQQVIRAILKSAGFARNIDWYHYSMASTQKLTDWDDGGGTPMGEAVWAMCNNIPMPAPGGGGQINNRTGTDPGDLTGGVTPAPFGGDCPSCNNPNGGLNASSAGNVGLQSAIKPGQAGDTRHYHQFVSVTLNPGQRIRAVIVWDSCPGASTGTAPASVATDIDLFISDPFHHTMDGSQSVMDVTEGFDIQIPANYPAGPYTLWWAAPLGPGCDGSSHEPLSWAIWWGNW